MPKNTVSDLITDQEIAFAHLILSGSMNDRSAAEAAGLNPDTAAYTKAKPRVRDYMSKHRAAVNEKLADQEAQGLRKLNLGRDQILNRLWELATLSHEVTRGAITGQIKALSMIIAIEGLIPDRRVSPSATQPAAPRIPEPEPTPGPAPKPANGQSFSSPDRNQPPVLNPFIYPEKNRVPDATSGIFDAILDRGNSLRLSLSPYKRFPGSRPGKR